MSTDLPILWLSGAGALLAAMTVLMFSILREQSRAEAAQARLAVVAGIQKAAAPTVRITVSRTTAAPSKGILQRILGLFGISLIRKEHYPVPWPLVLLIALVLARVIAGILTILIDTLAFILIPFVWVFVCRSFFGWIDEKRKQRLRDQMPDALSMIVRSVRVGIPVTEAMHHVAMQSQAPTSAEFQRVAHDLNIGVRLDAALRTLADRTELPEYQFFATALTLQAQTGGGLTETLENLAEVIRKRVALRAKAYALASEARTSALVLSALPFVSGAGLAVLSPTYIATLFIEEAGRNLLGIAVLSLGIGTFVMRLIIRQSLK